MTEIRFSSISIVIDLLRSGMAKNQYATELDVLSKNLFRIHKSLIEFQKRIYVDLENKNPSPYEMLHLLMNHPDFEWLRQVSALMAHIDESADDKKNPPTEDTVKNVRRELNELFVTEDTNIDFKQRLMIAMSKDPHLCTQIADLKAALSRG